MTGLNDTDIRLSDDLQLTRAADGDAPLCSDLECLYQNIMLEAITQKGDLFYDPDFGWSLYDFIQSEDDELIRIEIEQRARFGLQKRDVIIAESIDINVAHNGDVIQIGCSFQFTDEPEARQLNVVIDPVNVEVIISD